MTNCSLPVGIENWSHTECSDAEAEHVQEGQLASVQVLPVEQCGWCKHTF